jgi:hypothetical protein
MKHIQIDLHFVRDLVQKVSLQVRQVHTQDQLVDLLTKSLSKQCMDLLHNKIGLADGSSILRGRIRETCGDSTQIKIEHVYPKIMSNILSFILYLELILNLNSIDVHCNSSIVLALPFTCFLN